MRKTLAEVFRYKLANEHKWQRRRIEGEQAWQCLDCGRVYFGDHPPGPASNLGAVDAGGGHLGI